MQVFLREKERECIFCLIARESAFMNGSANLVTSVGTVAIPLVKRGRRREREIEIDGERECVCV